MLTFIHVVEFRSVNDVVYARSNYSCHRFLLSFMCEKKSTPTCIAEASFCVCCSMIEETLGLKFVYSVMYRPTSSCQ